MLAVRMAGDAGAGWNVQAADAELRWATRRSEVAIPPEGHRARARARAREVFLALAGRLRGAPRPGELRALYLHSVYDDDVRAFRELVVRLRGLGRFITTDELMATARGEREVSGVEFHLSFDDGFDNNYRNAFPVLEELGVHAAFFVPTAFVDASDADVLAGWWTRRSARRPTRHLTWAWLREMAAAGHEIGSHTRHHLRLSEISADAARLRDEVLGSKRELEDRLGRACRTISWPFGTHADFDAPTQAVVREAGYAACFSAVRGSVAPDPARLMDLPRHHFEPDWPWSHVRYFATGGGE
jgi:peptidoglycan/xylan/chitin deacetylase (PgdA/CDA1 family)